MHDKIVGSVENTVNYYRNFLEKVETFPKLKSKKSPNEKVKVNSMRVGTERRSRDHTFQKLQNSIAEFLTYEAEGAKEPSDNEEAVGKSIRNRNQTADRHLKPG